MKKTFITLLGSAAALIAVSSANAADAVVAAVPEAPETGNYVRVCDAFGTGYFYIPGSETCLKAGGAVEFSAGYDSRTEKSFAGVDAIFDLNTRADSEIGMIGTNLRLASRSNFDHYNLDVSEPGRTTDIELAYISVGPAFVGYKETLFNDNIGYGDAEDIFDGEGNALTAGFLQTDVAGGYYFGAALEANDRGNFDARFSDDTFPAVVARLGVADQTWGGLDLSAGYSEAQSELWLVKATADLKAGDALDFRLSAGYGENALTSGYLASAAAKYTISDSLSAFAGVAYLDIKGATDEGIGANVGATYEVVKDLDVTGQVTYTEADDNDGLNTKFTLNRKF